MIKRVSIKVTLKSLLLLASMEKLSKLDDLLQNICSFMAELLSAFTLFPVRAETLRYSYIVTLKWHLVLP